MPPGTAYNFCLYSSNISLDDDTSSSNIRTRLLDDNAFKSDVLSMMSEAGPGESNEELMHHAQAALQGIGSATITFGRDEISVCKLLNAMLQGSVFQAVYAIQRLPSSWPIEREHCPTPLYPPS
ncbi:hypothetical protein BDR05DRAFT_730732 [Suillus weaverae]|nr:hypothetical protein BDR05DRAFT_730732 [Suillus weaverae]